MKLRWVSVLKCSVIIPPFIKPYTPSYTAGILADIIRGCGSNVDILDANILFLEYIYKNHLHIKVNGIAHDTYSPQLEELLKKIKVNINNKEGLIEEEYNRLFNELKLRNLFLNRNLTKLHFSFFDIKINQKFSLKELINDEIFSAAINDMLIKTIPEISFDIAFISVMSKEQLYFSCMLSKYFRDKHRNCNIVLGGPYLDSLCIEEQKVLLTYFNCLCYGDAELIIPDLISTYIKYKKVTSHYGSAFYEGKELIQTRRHYANIRDIKKYKFHITDFEKYSYYYPIKKYPILTSRECCYGKCLFCTNKGALRHMCRITNIDEVVNVLKTASNHYSFFEFLDDNMHAVYLNILADKIIESKLKITWIANSRFYDQFLTKAVCKNLYDSGCRKLFMGLESYNQDVLNSMRKGINKNYVVSILENLKNVGICTHISVLFGFPGETLEQAQDTYKFLCDNIYLCDLIEVNRFVSHDTSKREKSNYDVDSMVKEIRNMINSCKKTPTYYHVYELLKAGGCK